jgi:hypothetical protein
MGATDSYEPLELSIFCALRNLTREDRGCLFEKEVEDVRQKFGAPAASQPSLASCLEKRVFPAAPAKRSTTTARSFRAIEPLPHDFYNMPILLRP